MENNEYVKYGADDERSAQRQASAKRIAQQAYHGMRYYLDRDFKDLHDKLPPF